MKKKNQSGFVIQLKSPFFCSSLSAKMWQLRPGAGYDFFFVFLKILFSFSLQLPFIKKTKFQKKFSSFVTCGSKGSLGGGKVRNFFCFFVCFDEERLWKMTTLIFFFFISFIWILSLFAFNFPWPSVFVFKVGFGSQKNVGSHSTPKKRLEKKEPRVGGRNYNLYQSKSSRNGYNRQVWTEKRHQDTLDCDQQHTWTCVGWASRLCILHIFPFTFL